MNAFCPACNSLRFTPGSDLRSKSPTGLESDTAVSAPSPTLLIDTEKTRVATQEEGKAEHDEEDRSQAKSVAKRTGKNTMPLRYASPPIGVLGYFVAEDYRYPRRTRSCENRCQEIWLERDRETTHESRVVREPCNQS